MRWCIVIAVVAMAIGWAVISAADGPDKSFAEHFNLPRDPESVLGEVLARREFEEDPLSRWIRRFRDRAAAMLAEIFRWIVNRLPSVGPVKLSGDVLGTIGTALLVGVAAVILIAVGWWLAVAFARWVRSRDAPHLPRPELDGTENIAGLRVRAMAEAEHGNFGRAVVHLFRYAILRLNEDGLLAYHQGKTNRELLAALTADETVRIRVGEMVLVFNRVRYGRAPCNRDEYDRFAGLCRDAVGGD